MLRNTKKLFSINSVEKYQEPKEQFNPCVITIVSQWQTKCDKCGEVILAGLPGYGSNLEVMVPLTYEQVDFMKTTHFFIGADFDIECNPLAHTHIVKGYKENTFLVSEKPFKEGFIVQGFASMEKAVTAYIRAVYARDRLPAGEESPRAYLRG